MFSNVKCPKNNSDDSFQIGPDQSDSEEEKELFKPRNQKSDFEGLIEGSWTETQKGLFLAFMEHHRNIFLSKRKRKSEKIFRVLADFLGNRNPAQCRSHFQKLIKKYRRVRYILNQAKKGIEQNKYKIYCLQVQEKLAQMKQKQKTNQSSTQKIQVKEQEIQDNNFGVINYNFAYPLGYYIFSQNNLNYKTLIQNEYIKQEMQPVIKMEFTNNIKTQQ